MDRCKLGGWMWIFGEILRCLDAVICKNMIRVWRGKEF